MSSKNHEWYVERDGEIKQLFDTGTKTEEELSLDFNLSVQRIRQILGASHWKPAKNGREPKPPAHPVGPYWVTCRDEHKSFLEWFWPECCYKCHGRNIERERVSWA